MTINISPLTKDQLARVVRATRYLHDLHDSRMYMAARIWSLRRAVACKHFAPKTKRGMYSHELMHLRIQERSDLDTRYTPAAIRALASRVHHYDDVVMAWDMFLAADILQGVNNG